MNQHILKDHFLVFDVANLHCLTGVFPIRHEQDARSKYLLMLLWVFIQRYLLNLEIFGMTK